ncbi:MAG TPA: hypothetical protein VF109_06155 [Mycobacteriales bacterium]
MLDADAPLDAGPYTIAFGDASDPLRVYACAAAPRLTVEDGRPELTVLAYRRGSGPAEGGQVTLTTTLGLTEDERDRIAAALAPPPPPGAGTGPLPRVLPRVLPPHWLSGAVTVRLAGGVELTGTPSLSGPNTCVLAGTLDAGQVAALLAAVQAGLPDATAAYSVDVAASRTAGGTATRERHGPGFSSTARVDVTTGTAGRLHLELRGPLRLPASHRHDAVTFVALRPRHPSEEIPC